jgi:hypothetical protein
MEVQSPSLTFPDNFCCNCGDTNCVSEIQDTRITRYFAIFGTETTFHLSLPICAACRKTTRRRPAGFFGRLLVFALMVVGWFLALIALGAAVELPLWMAENLSVISLVLGAILTFVFYRLRSAKPPKTSFYQPVRIKRADVRIASVMGGPGQVVYMKLAFTNQDYLGVFTNANREAISAGHVAVVKA